MQLFLGPTLHLLVALTFVVVALFQWRRQTSGGNRIAARFFVLWWASLALVEFGQAAQGFIAEAGNTDLTIHATIEYAMALAFSIGLWGLLTYAFYLWGAPERIWIGTGTYYGIYGGLILATLAWLDPVAIQSTEFGVRLEFAREISATWLRAIFGLFLLPPLMAALSILHVARLEVEPQVRKRAIFVGLGLILWCLSSWLSLSIAVQANTAMHFLPVVLDGMAGMVIVWAYHFIKSPLRQHAADEEPAGETSWTSS